MSSWIWIWLKQVKQTHGRKSHSSILHSLSTLQRHWVCTRSIKELLTHSICTLCVTCIHIVLHEVESSVRYRCCNLIDWNRWWSLCNSSAIENKVSGLSRWLIYNCSRQTVEALREVTRLLMTMMISVVAMPLFWDYFETFSVELEISQSFSFKQRGDEGGREREREHHLNPPAVTPRALLIHFLPLMPSRFYVKIKPPAALITGY